MDLRVIKTKQNIKKVFLELRKNNNLDKIKVSEICKLAMINKSTFYRYYDDVYDLSYKLQKEAFENLSNNFKNLRDIFTNPDEFIDRLFKISLNSPELIILFNNQEDKLITMAQDKIEKVSKSSTIQEKSKISIAFMIGGLVFAYKGLLEGTYSKEYFREITGKTVKFLSDFVLS